MSSRGSQVPVPLLAFSPQFETQGRGIWRRKEAIQCSEPKKGEISKCNLLIRLLVDKNSELNYTD